MKNLDAHPPRFFLKFFRWYCHPKMHDYIEGDLMEVYEVRLKTLGKRKADFKFIIDVLLLFRPGIIKPAEGYKKLNHYGMFKSYFKIGWRNLVKNRGYSFINVIGLAIGMTVAIVIGLWIFDELSFDSYYQNHKRLAQVMLNQTGEGIVYTGGTIAPPIEEPMRTKYGSDFKAFSFVSFSADAILASADRRLSHPGVWVQSDFPEMFSLNLIKGSREALKDPSTLLLSQSTAKSLFDDTDPINKMIRIDNRFDLKVGGVYEDMPSNTTFASAGFLLPWDNRANVLNTITDWDYHSCELFVQLADGADLDQVSDKIRNIPTPYIIASTHEQIMLHPMDKIHLYSEFQNGKVVGGKIQYVWLISIIGGFVLLLACINFMNLSTARSEKRAREVGIRKTVGSRHNQLVGQFLIESIVVSFTALVLSIILVQLSLPFFNSLANKQMSILWINPLFWLFISGFALFCGIISGSYPAFYLSSFNPVKVLKGTFKAGRLATLPRKVLVVIQFTVSITLIIGTVIIFEQIQFAKNRAVGYTRSGLISVPIKTPDLQVHFDAVHNDLLQTGVVENVAESSHIVTEFNNNDAVEWQGKDPAVEIDFRDVNVTSEFGKTIGWTVKEGRDFSQKIASDSSAVLINETAVRVTGLKNPVGETIKYHKKEYAIIGIVKDMVTRSPYQPIEPAIFLIGKWLSVITIRIKPGTSISEALAKIEPIFKRHDPNAPFEFKFIDDEYGRKFFEKERIGNLSRVFAMLAIFISCLGIFGLASFVAEQRTKEIGVRKVLGASVANLWQLLSRDFLALVLLSCLIAIPIAYYFLNEWLQHYEYRTEISWWIFALVTMGALSITLLTVSFHSLKAALINPVNSLKSE